MKQVQKLVMVLTILVVAGSLAACSTTVSRGVAADGSGAQTLLWPLPEDASDIHDAATSGTWPTVDTLALMHSGLTKDQIIALIGPPHYFEGNVNVQEWNYLFHLRDPDTGVAQLCQYKILFDEDEIARSFYWNPAACNPFRVRVLTFNALFEFDKYGLDDINPAGLHQLQLLVDELQASTADGSSIMIAGYADPIGSESYNLELSRHRVETVARYMIDHGVPASAIKAQGRGESSSLTDCDALSGQARIACLHPERRVVVTIRTRKANSPAGRASSLEQQVTAQ